MAGMDIKYRILPDEDWDQSLSRSIGSTVTGADDVRHGCMFFQIIHGVREENKNLNI